MTLRMDLRIGNFTDRNLIQATSQVIFSDYLLCYDQGFC
jgi:hypothetical protein